MPYDGAYRNRTEAGKRLAEELTGYRGEKPVVAGLPRGGVVLAAEVARALGAELDVIFAGKLRAPSNPELAIGAVGEDGHAYINQSATDMLHIDERYMEEEKKERLKEVRSRLDRYRKVKKKTPLAGRAVILVDDGLATGSTMVSAVHAASAEGASKIVVAVAGGPQDTVDRIRSLEEVDAVVCPVIPRNFYAVSQLYEEFDQVEDYTVMEILKKFSE